MSAPEFHRVRWRLAGKPSWHLTRIHLLAYPEARRTICGVVLPLGADIDRAPQGHGFCVNCSTKEHNILVSEGVIE